LEVIRAEGSLVRALEESGVAETETEIAWERA
jgi:hypothetical protein